MKRLILAAAILAATPTAASAATVTAGPAKLSGGNTLTLHAVDARKDTLTLMVQRGKLTNGETEVLTVTEGVRVTVRGRVATIKGTLGRRGSVDLKLRDPRTDRSAKLPKGCTGSRGTTYAGRLVGRLRLKLAGGRTVTLKSLPGYSYAGGQVRCDRDPVPGRGDGGDGDGGGGNEPQLVLSTQSDDATTTFLATRRTLQFSRIEAARKDGRAMIATMSTVHAAGTNLLSVSDGGAAATVNAAGAFTGTGLFTSLTGGGAFATGPLTGSLAVKPSFAPAITIAGENAVLMNGG